MLTLLSFVAALAVLIAIHEYGHFQMAKWCGVKILKFSLGFGKPLYSKKFGLDKTEFVISALPLGGYVKMLDERELSESELKELAIADRLRSFNRQKLWKRFLIVLAGPLANFLLAIFLFWILMAQGVTALKPVIGKVLQGTAAYQSGLKQGDLVKSIENKKVKTWQDIYWALLQNIGETKEVELTIVDNQGRLENHPLSLSILSKKDLEGDFLKQLGLRPNQPKIPAKINEVLQNSASSKAGLKVDDIVLSVDGLKINSSEEFVNLVQSKPNKSLFVTIDRASKVISLEITPSLVKEGGRNVGRIGAGFKMDSEALAPYLVKVKYSLAESLFLASQKTWDISLFSLKMIGNMLIGEASLKTISGPVTIASYSGKSAHQGWASWIGFLAMLSISLGVMNLLPIPVLDGGHLLYYTVEAIKGSPVSDRMIEIGQRVGFLLLGLLMIFAFYNDINRLIAG
jgi:regulator of sigma E protease